MSVFNTIVIVVLRALAISFSVFFPIAMPVAQSQDLPSFSDLTRKWQDVAKQPYCGEYRVNIDTTGGASVTAKKSVDQRLVSADGFLLISRAQPDTLSHAMGLNDEYGFTIKLREGLAPELASVFFIDDAAGSDGESAYRLAKLHLRYNKIKQHPGLILFDAISWVDVVRSSGFSVSSVARNSDSPDRYVVQFACNPSPEESEGKVVPFIPVLKNGSVELLSLDGGKEFWPASYSFDFCQKPGAEQGHMEVTNEFEESGRGSVRLKRMHRKRDYMGRTDFMTMTCEYVSDEVPVTRSFKLSRFGLPEPSRGRGASPNIWAWSVCAVGLVAFCILVFRQFRHGLNG